MLMILLQVVLVPMVELLTIANRNIVASNHVVPVIKFHFLVVIEKSR